MRVGSSRSRVGGGALALAFAAGLAGCSSGDQNTLAAHSHPQHQIAHLWWVMFVGAWIGFGVIVLLLFLGWARRNRTVLPGGGGERAATIAVVVLGVVVPIAVLSALFAWSDTIVIRSTAAPKHGTTQLTVNVIGHQWWWEVRYPGTSAVTANDLHIPTNTRVNLVATTADVIHSFWVPELNRKIDTVPGRENRILLDADRAGIYRGQCSEYCGLQHAHMTITVVAEPPARFRAWLRNMARPVRAPTGAAARQGKRVFLTQSCAQCHQLRGTAAHGDAGPDLTHLATRSALAADTIPNTRTDLAEWIADPQHVKPGNKMPGLPLNGRQLNDLVAYLRSLR